MLSHVPGSDHRFWRCFEISDKSPDRYHLMLGLWNGSCDGLTTGCMGYLGLRN